MHTRYRREATIDRWRLEPRYRAWELGDAEEPDQTPALWKDLTLASVVALLLWMAAAAVFG